MNGNRDSMTCDERKAEKTGNKKIERCCGTCVYYELMSGDFGRCKCTDANGYDLIVENSSFCESYKQR
ncbi:MAG: hypothetical protein ACOCWO_00675 [Candidatus Muiribacteriaceae bacterium]